MPNRTQWLVADRVKYIHLSGVVTLEEIRTMTSLREQELLANLPQQNVHYIVDTRQIERYPNNIREINAHLSGRITHTGWMIFLTDDFLIRHLGSILGQLFHFNVKTASDVVEAYRFLQSTTDVPFPQDWPAHTNETIPMRT